MYSYVPAKLTALITMYMVIGDMDRLVATSQAFLLGTWRPTKGCLNGMRDSRSQGGAFTTTGRFQARAIMLQKCEVGCLKVTIFHGVCDDEESIVRCHSVHAENNLTILGRIGLMMCTPRKHRDQRWK